MPGGSIRVDNGDSETRAKLPHRPAHKVICQVEPVFMDRAEREANANILAAAPDLLAACKRIAQLQVTDSDDEAFKQLRSAITRAEGGAA